MAKRVLRTKLCDMLGIEYPDSLRREWVPR